MSDRPIRVVLDTSAIIVYTRGSTDVGEVIAEVDEEKAGVALPLLCLVEASRVAFDADKLGVLVAHRATVVVSPEPEDWRPLAALYEIVGRLEAASAALLAYDSCGYVVTAHGGLYARLAGGGPIIEVGAGSA